LDLFFKKEVDKSYIIVYTISITIRRAS
jgi:hypothetical protein